MTTQIKVTIEYLLETEEDMTEIQLLDVINQEVNSFTLQPTVFARTKQGSEVSIKKADLTDSAIIVYEKPM